MSRGALEHMFQMSAIYLKEQLNAACKVIDNMYKFLLEDRRPSW